MIEKYFLTIGELRIQAVKDKACKPGLAWLRRQLTIAQVIKGIPHNYRMWCLQHGYIQFAKDCQWNKLDTCEWPRLLCHQPQFFKFCPWSKLNGYHWTILLKKQPQFSKICPWDKLEGTNWAFLLSKQPQFSKFCPWEKLNKEDWVYLLRRKPNFIKFCSLEKLSIKDRIYLSTLQPRLIKYLIQLIIGKSHIMKEKKFAIIEELREQAIKDKACKADLEWLDKQESLDQVIKDISNDWRVWCLSKGYCQFSKNYKWEKLDGDNWVRLLIEQPKFSKKCKWEKLDGDNWARLLIEQPQFAKKCKWKKLDRNDWASLLSFQPKFEKYKQQQKEIKIMKEKKFATLEELKNQAIKDEICYDGLEWLDEQKSLKEVFEKIGLGYRLWCLRKGYTQFAEYCDWDKLTCFDWPRLLGKQPQFADKCNFDRFNGNDWAYVLREQPQLADRCDFDKLNGFKWSRLLSKQPQFADKCNFDKLNGYHWAWLLSVQPQFSEFCNWNKLDVFDWDRLLSKQPQLEKYKI